MEWSGNCRVLPSPSPSPSLSLSLSLLMLWLLHLSGHHLRVLRNIQQTDPLVKVVLCTVNNNDQNER